MRHAAALLLALWLALLTSSALSETPDGFSFSGGTGKVTITCPQITLRDGACLATIVFSSPNYPSVQLDGVAYTAAHAGDTSVFEIPAPVNQSFQIIATTTAMSQPHDITYTLFIGVGMQAPHHDAPEAPVPAQPAAVDAEINGLTWERRWPLRYAERFTVDCYQGGYRLIRIVDGDTALVVPEGMDVPAGLDPNVLVLKQPVRNIYLAATSAMALFDRLDALDAIRLSALDADHWHIKNAAAAMRQGDIRYAGKYSEPDYELLLQSGCALAIESTMIFHTPKVRELIEQLGIPVLVDRSSYETHPLARTEWIKLYAAILGREAEAEAFFDERAAIIDACADYPNTEKTVAFFYIASDGSVVVRAASDYVPKMIELAGGRYALHDIAGDTARASVSTTMERFYSAAVDADFLIYNAAISAAPKSLDDLFSLSGLFRDFKAVRDGNVFVTGKDLYQETDDVAELISDIHAILTGAGDTRFLTRIE